MVEVIEEVDEGVCAGVVRCRRRKETT